MNSQTRILVVDDDPRFLRLTSALLGSSGYEIMGVSTGKDALNAVSQNHPDLVLLDVILPDMNGFEVCRQIKSGDTSHTTFVLLHSGVDTSSEAQVKGLDSGADGYVLKGISRDELIARINSLMRIKRAEDALQQARDELDHRVKERTAELAEINARLVSSERALWERLRFESLLANLSTRFVAIPASEMDQEIEDAQRHVCELLGLDRSTLWRSVIEGSNTRMILAHAYQLQGKLDARGLTAEELFPWTLRKILRGETVIISRMKDLPPEAARDSETWLRYGTKSTVVFPLVGGGGSILGAISFTQLWAERDWPETVRNYLQLIAQLFGNALFRKQSEESLRSSEENLKLAADSAEIGLWSLDTGTRRFWNSETFRKLVGVDQSVNLSEEAFLGLIHSEDREGFLQVMKEAGLSGRDAQTEYRVVRPDGAVRWFVSHARSLLAPSRQATCLTGVTIDVTERREMERQIRASAEEWQSTFDSVRDSTMILDQDLRVIRVNASALSFLGVPLEHIQGKECVALMREANKPDELSIFTEVLKTKKQEESDVFDKNTNSWFNVSAAPIFDDSGEVVRIIHTIRDVSARKKAEAEAFNAQREVLRTERLLRMGELMASLAHELNQPLTSILSNAQAALHFLQRDRLDVIRFGEIMTDIIHDDKRAGEIIRSLKSMVSPEEWKSEAASLNDVLAEVTALFRSEAIIRHIKIETECAASLPPVMINRTQIAQVLLNLVMNAAESISAFPGGGRILMRTRASGEGGVQVVVQDTGQGIETEDPSSLFNPFFTTKRSGLGLGLSLSRSIIEAHGGHIWAENNVDGGATFCFELPAGRSQ